MLSTTGISRSSRVQATVLRSPLPGPAEDSDDDELAPDVLAAAAMQARDFAALQARQQGMFPGLAFYLVRLTQLLSSDWSKTYHEYVDFRSWGNHGVHVHDGRGCAQAPPCYFAEDHSGIVGQVDSRDVAAVQCSSTCLMHSACPSASVAPS
jgi:hypothetical protein